MRPGVSLRDAMCEALAKSLENLVPVKLWKVPAGMDPLTMTERVPRAVPHLTPSHATGRVTEPLRLLVDWVARWRGGGELRWDL